MNTSILVTDEIRFGQKMTKFPGGGLQYGEGTVDCLKRECLEEMGQEIEVIDHFYTTDYFQPTLFLAEPQQLISVYYTISLKEPLLFSVTDKPFDFEEFNEGSQIFRWILLEKIAEDDLTLHIDKRVVSLLNEKFLNHQ